jgi:glycerophosphoryl diester phosphodiesterase
MELSSWLRIAHRGASVDAPENTIAAFKKALTIGVDAIELDVRLTLDGEVVVIHDAALDRTTDLSGFVSQLTLEEIQQADAGSHLSKDYRDQKVPTLQQVLEVIPRNVKILLEVKCLEAALPSARVVLDMGRKSQVVFISFIGEVLTELGLYDAGLQIGFLVDEPFGARLDPVRNARDMLAKGRSLGTSMLGVHWKIASPEFIREVHRQGGRVWVWTVDDADEMVKLIEASIDGIASNYPDKLRALEKQKIK